MSNKKAKFIYQGRENIDPNKIAFNKVTDQKRRYILNIIPKMNDFKKEIKNGKKEIKKNRKAIKRILNERKKRREDTYEYENGEVYPKDINLPNIVFIQYGNPHSLITKLYENEEEWYTLKELIEASSEEAFLSYEQGMWLASISSAVNCCEYILKYELFRKLKKEQSELLEDEEFKYELTLGKIKANRYDCLELLGIKSDLQANLDYLNLVRNAIYHFNPKKGKEASEKGTLEIEENNSITHELIKPIIAHRVYSIMIELIDKFYNEEKAIEYYKEATIDWINRGELTKKELDEIDKELRENGFTFLTNFLKSAH